MLYWPHMDEIFNRTVDHDIIRDWIEERNGTPVTILGADDEEVIDIAFGPQTPDFEAITWEEFFERFDQSGLVFQYTDETIPGEEKQGYNFVSADESTDLDDETELPEVNGLADENLNNDFGE